MRNREQVLTRAVAYRLVGLAILILSLVGMHHLIASQCHHATSISTIGHAATQAHEVPMSAYGEPPHQDETPSGLQTSQRPVPAPTDMAICLAVLIALLGSLRPAAPLGPANQRGNRTPPRRDGPRRHSTQPSLHMMSRSRT